MVAASAYRPLTSADWAVHPVRVTLGMLLSQRAGPPGLGAWLPPYAGWIAGYGISHTFPAIRGRHKGVIPLATGGPL